MSYEEYIEYARVKGFQALSESSFEAMVVAGYDFERGCFV